MIGELIDSAVSLFSPAAAAKRAHARNVYRSVSGSGYASGQPSRTHESWKPQNRSPDLEMSGTADMTRARARALVRDNAYARGILSAWIRNVVGCGIRPQCRVKMGDGETPNRPFIKAAETLFQRWSRVCDVTGQLSFFEMQRAVLREMKEAGECLIHFVQVNDPARPISLALEMIDADRLASDAFFPRGINKETGNEVRRGVEIDATGRPVAYWIYKHHPQDLTTYRHEAERIPADEILHLFKQERIGQTRGVSAFSPCLWWLKSLGYYVENEMQSSAIASCFGVAIETVDAGMAGSLADSIDTSNTDAEGNQFEYLQPGLVTRLMPGEKITTINPSRQAANSAEFINLMLRSMAVGSGLSFERLARDYSKTNFSSNRAGDLEDRRDFRIEQQWLIHHLCSPVWRRFLIHAVAEGAEGMPSDVEFLSAFDDWTEHVWLPPGWEWVDPQKEAQASQIAIDSHLTTLTDELAARGRDFEETLRQRADELKLIKELGLPEAQMAASADPAKRPQPEEADAETVDA